MSSIKASAQQPAGRVGFGFSLYGMKQVPLTDALQICADAGYDCIELPVMADWPGAPEQLSRERRVELRGAMETQGLRLSAIMENLVLLSPEAEHARNLDRLRAQAAELGHELQRGQPVIIETVMGASRANGIRFGLQWSIGLASGLKLVNS